MMNLKNFRIKVSSDCEARLSFVTIQECNILSRISIVLVVLSDMFNYKL